MVFVTGDIHGDESRLTPENVPRYLNVKENDTIIVAGDFGLIWNDDLDYTDDDYPVSDNEKLDTLASGPYRICFVDGNHENHPKIATFPVVDFCGGKAHEIRKDKIYHLIRGEIYEIEGKKIYVMGGAYSIDRYMRQLGVSWWSEELPNNDDYKNSISNLKKADYKVDYIITHTAPEEIIRHMRFSPDPHDAELTGHLGYIMLNVDFKRWYFGHFHRDEFHNFTYKGQKKCFRPLFFEMCRIDELECNDEDVETSGEVIMNLKIDVLSRERAEALTARDITEKTVMVSISSVDCRRPSIVECENLLDVLYLNFNDVDRGLAGAMRPEQAVMIADFVRRYQYEVGRIIFHCEAGISRSAGCAAATMKYIYGTDDPIFNSRRFCPNLHCYGLMLNAFFGQY